MTSAIRSVLIVVVGFVAAAAVMVTVEMVNGKWIYPELGKSAEGVTDPGKIKEIMANAPVGAFVVVLIGWALGSGIGGFLVTLMSRKPAGARVLVLGMLLTLAGLANNRMLSPPLWFWFASLPVLPTSTYVGSRLIPRKGPDK